jgi:hypothetical protein
LDPVLKLIFTIFGMVWTTIFVTCLTIFANTLINGQSGGLVVVGLTIYASCLSIVILAAYTLFRFWRTSK